MVLTGEKERRGEPRDITKTRIIQGPCKAGDQMELQNFQVILSEIILCLRENYARRVMCELCG